MFWFNIGSCLLYFATYFLVQNGYYNLILFLISSEIIIHACLAVYYLGWNTGFHYYIIAVVPVIFFSALKSNIIKLLSTLIICAIYIAAIFYSDLLPPIYFLEEEIVTKLKYINIFLLFIALAFPAYYYNSAVVKTRKELKELNNQLHFLASTDPLTELLNRRAMNKRMELEVEKKNNQSQFVVVIADIDDFKLINDYYGHSCGDFILQELAQLMERELVSKGLVSRWGGEEFLIFLPKTTLNQGLAIAKRLKEKIASYTFEYQNKKIGITMTFGASEYSYQVELEECIKEADQALYQGKQDGKNKVAVY